jgi:hypothetical protein
MSLLLLSTLAACLLGACASTPSERMDQRQQTLDRMNYSAPASRDGTAPLPVPPPAP